MSANGEPQTMEEWRVAYFIVLKRATTAEAECVRLWEQLDAATRTIETTLRHADAAEVRVSDLREQLDAALAHLDATRLDPWTRISHARAALGEHEVPAEE